MPRPHLLYKAHTNSFVVQVKNLESLEVEQIVALQKFVEARRGMFDFETYTFTIRKKLDYFEFTKLLDSLGLACDVEELDDSEQKVRIDFGQYKGMYLSDLPDSYILWLYNNYKGSLRTDIEAEYSLRN